MYKYNLFIDCRKSMHRLKFAALRVCIRKENVNLIIMGTLRKKRNLYRQQAKMNPNKYQTRQTTIKTKYQCVKKKLIKSINFQLANYVKKKTQIANIRSKGRVIINDDWMLCRQLSTIVNDLTSTNLITQLSGPQYLKDTIKLTQDKMKNLICLFLLKGLDQNSVHFNKDIIQLDLKKTHHTLDQAG